MLSMKTLRVAIVTIGTALLLGPGFVAAQLRTTEILLSDTGSGVTAAVYANESLQASEVPEVRSGPPNNTITHYGLRSPAANTQHWLVIPTGVRIDPNDEDARLELRFSDGMVFNENVLTTLSLQKSGTSTVAGLGTSTCGSAGNESCAHVQLSNHASRFRGGGEGDDFIVFGFATEGTPPGVLIGEFLWMNLKDSLAVAGPGSYEVTSTLYTGTGTGAATYSETKKGTIVQVVVGVDAGVAPDAPAVADVGTGFLQFLDGTEEGTPVERLGMFHAVPKELPASQLLLAADDGAQADASDLFAGTNPVSLTVNGDLSIGAFRIGNDTDIPPVTSNIMECPASSATATSESPTKSELTMKMGVTNEGTVSKASGRYELCVDVNDDGANVDPIPVGEYTATLMVTGPGDDAEPIEFVKDGPIGRIVRNGSEVRITYLTVSDKYNQRLIIVNRSNRMVEANLGGLITEEGTTVEGTNMATGIMIDPNSKVVLRVSELLEFTGLRSRAAATVTANAPSGMLAVATTQVNLEDGSTDTVLYQPEETQ